MEHSKAEKPRLLVVPSPVKSSSGMLVRSFEEDPESPYGTDLEQYHTEDEDLDAFAPAEGNEGGSPMSMSKKTGKVEVDDKELVDCDTSDSLDSIEYTSKGAAKYQSKTFEKFYYCRLKSKFIMADGGRKITGLTKSFWLYPPSTQETKQADKEEGDRLTNIVLRSKYQCKLIANWKEGMAFLTDFFAQYNEKNTEFVNFFVLDQDGKKKTNRFNKKGWKYIYSLVFEDFEILPDLTLDINPTMLIFESRYPFRGLFEHALRKIYREFRMRRLALFSGLFDVTESPQNNLSTADQYDSGYMKNTIDELEKSFFGSLRESYFNDGVSVPALSFSEFKFSPTAKFGYLYDSAENIFSALRGVTFKIFLRSLSGLIESRSLAIYASKPEKYYPYMLFVCSLFKPVGIPHVLFHNLTKDCYNYLRSPVPAIACIQDSMKYVINKLSANLDDMVVHVDLDKNDYKGTPKFKLEKLFKGSKVFDKLKANYEKIQKTLYKESFVELTNPDNLYVIETLILIRSLLNDIFMFDDKGLKAAKNKKEYVLSKTKLDKSAHSQLLSGQMFASLCG